MCRDRLLAVLPALELPGIRVARTPTRQLVDLAMRWVLRCRSGRFLTGQIRSRQPPVFRADVALPRLRVLESIEAGSPMAKIMLSEAVPNPVWVLLYRTGLSRKKIAELDGAPPSTVGYHLSVARSADPGLKAEHDAAAGKKPAPQQVPHGMRRMHEVIGFVEETGRYPSPAAEDVEERKLAAWLRRRRRDARAGLLDPAVGEGLAVLPGWQRKPREVAAESGWQQQLAALIAYRLAGNDWPRHKAADTREEHELGFWLHTQRLKLRRGKLSATKLEALDKALPGWLTGRKRGRKARRLPEPIPLRPR